MPPETPSHALFEIRNSKDHTADIAFLRKKGFVALSREDLPPYPFRLPFDWHADPFGDRNWMFQIHAWRMLDPWLIRLLREPDHPRSLGDVHDIIADWYRVNIKEKEGQFTWYDMSTGLRGLKLAWLLMLLDERGVEYPDPEMMSDLVSHHIAELARPAALNKGNHGLFQLNGLMALAKARPNHRLAQKGRAYAIEQMTSLLDRQLGEHGVHTENSPYYHFFVVSKIDAILRAPWWKLPEMMPAHKKLERAQLAADWLSDPAGRCPPIGDLEAKTVRKSFKNLERSPHSRSGATLGAILDGYGIVRSAPEVPIAKSSMLFQTASFRRPLGHKHSDCLSFVWQEGGQDILIDSGKYSYQKDEMRAYFVSSRAHNTVEIGQEVFRSAKAHAYCSGMRQVTPIGKAWLIETEADRRHLGAIHRRCVYFRPGRFLLALDHITFSASSAGSNALEEAPEKRELTSWWHFDPALELTPEAGGWLARGLNGGRQLRISHSSNADIGAASLHKGEMKPRPQGWVSPAYLEYEPAPVLGFPALAESDYLAATLFEIIGKGRKPKMKLAWQPSGKAFRLSDRSPLKLWPRTYKFGDITFITP